MADVKKFPDYQSFKDDDVDTTLTAKFTSFDQVLKAIGPFNIFHIGFIYIFQISALVLCGNFVFLAYATLKPEVKCITADNKSFELDHADSIDFCMIYQSRKCVELHWKTPFKTVIEEWNLICDLDYVPQMINSIQGSGEFIALGLAGPLSDAFGRKSMLSLLYSAFLVVILGSSLSTDWKTFALFRFLVGGFIQSTKTIYQIWAMELTDERHNVIMNLAGSYQFAYMITALIAYLCYQWRFYLFIMTLIGIIPVIFIAFIFIESPRWQVQKGKLDQASHGLTKMSSTQVSAQQLANLPYESHTEAKLLLFSLFSTKNLTIYTMVLSLGVFATFTTINAYIFQVTQFSGNPFNSFILYGGLRIFIPIIIYFFDQYMRWFGRRQMFLIPMGLICLLYSLLALRNDYFPHLVPHWHWNFYCMISGAVIANFLWVALAQYTVELYPTVMRNTSYTFTEIFHTFAGILVPQLVYLEKYWPSLLFYVVIILTLLSFISGFIILPETKGKDLPETIDTVPQPWIIDYNKE